MKVLIAQTQFPSSSPPLSHSQTSTIPSAQKLSSDFQKNNKPATWAKNHPKKWGSEYWRFSAGTDPKMAVTSTSVTSDEKYLAISISSRICIFDVECFEIVCILESETSVVQKVEFAPMTDREGYELVCFAQRNDHDRGLLSEIQLWHLNEHGIGSTRPEWKVEGRLSSFGSRAFTPNGSTLLYLSELHDRWGTHPTVTAISVQTGETKFQMQHHTDSIMWTGFSPDGNMIATTSWDGLCALYDAKSGKLIRDYGPTGGQNWSSGFSADSKNLAVSRASAVDGANTFVWRTDESRSFPATLQGGKGWQRDVSWSPDGKKLAIGAADARLEVFDARSLALEQIWQLQDGPERWLREVNGIQWLENGKKILFKAGDASTQMYDFCTNEKWNWGPSEGQELTSYAWGSCVVMEKRGLLGSVDRDGSMRIWKL